MKGFANVKKKLEGLLDTNKQIGEIDEAALKLSVIDQANIFILHLELDQQRTSKILLHVSKK